MNGKPVEPAVIGRGFWFEELALGTRFETMGRTLTETEVGMTATALGRALAGG